MVADSFITTSELGGVTCAKALCKEMVARHVAEPSTFPADFFEISMGQHWVLKMDHWPCNRNLN